MSEINSYGGECPNCKNSLIMKYNKEKNSLNFDACPNCSFLNAKINDIYLDDLERMSLWEDIFFSYNVNSIDELRSSLIDTDTDDDTINRIYPSVFDYSDVPYKEIKEFIFFKKNQ